MHNPDKESYEAIWDIVIKKRIEELLQEYSIVNVSKGSKEKIWNSYCDFNNEARKFMSENLKRLDRHKVTACYMYAILKAKIFYIDTNDYKIKLDNKELIDKALFDEKLALSVGLSILRSFIISNIENNGDVFGDNLILLKKIQNGLIYPYEKYVGHGCYYDNFCIELYHTKKESKYNILSLAHILYLLELYNKVCFVSSYSFFRKFNFSLKKNKSSVEK